MGEVMKERLPAFQEAVRRLREVLREPSSDVVRDSAIKRFEMAFEQAWKCLRLALESEGILVQSPRESLRQAFRLGWIEDERWVRMLEDRNLSVHTYNEELAQAIYGRLPLYLELLEALSRFLEERDKADKTRT